MDQAAPVVGTDGRHRSQAGFAAARLFRIKLGGVATSYLRDNRSGP
jgi:hypothetical protein